QRHDHECNANRSKSKTADDHRQHQPGKKTHAEGWPDAPVQMVDRQCRAIEAGGEEHGMAKAQEARIAESDVVAHGEDGQHHHAGKDPVMIIGQHKVEAGKPGHESRMQPYRPVFTTLHRAAIPAGPNRPCGRNTSTSATSSVASIFARVGEKNMEMMPSDRPMSSAATIVPRSEPSP